nr:radical SAM protein [Nitrospirota bacterium]
MLDSLTRPVLNVLRGRPILAVFEVTLRCNSACGYCDLPLNRGRYEMTREEIRGMGAELYRDGLRFLFVQGGEPLLRRDLPEILEDLHELGFGLTLITNGTKFTRPLVERLASLPLNLSVSLDTLDRQRYRAIRGADQLADVLAGLDLLRDFPHPKYLTTIVSKANRDEVEAMVRFAKAHGFMPVVGAYHWGIERYGKADEGLQYDRRLLAGVFEQVLESGLVPRGYFRHYLRDNVRWLSGGTLDRCDAGRYSIAIDASGNVAACLAQTFAGNLLRQPLSDILARFDREAIARCSDRSSCNLLCSRVVGSVLRHPVTAAMTPLTLKKVEV